MFKPQKMQRSAQHYRQNLTTQSSVVGRGHSSGPSSNAAGISCADAPIAVGVMHLTQV